MPRPLWRQGVRTHLAFVALLILTLPTRSLSQIEPQPQRKDLERRALEQEEAEQPTLTRLPEIKTYFDPRYPESIQKEGIEGEVILLLTISDEGIVVASEVLESPHEELSESALEASTKLEFVPAQIDHQPASVQIEFSYVFSLDVMPAPQEDASNGDEESKIIDEEPTLTISPNLVGKVLKRGFRDPVDGAMVVSGEQYTTSDKDGRFELFLTPDESHKVEVRASGFHSFETIELIREEERNEVVYYLQERGSSPYETIVRAARPRKEVSRVVLSREEAQRVPGTFGDPLRVIENLPGMARSSFIGGQLLVRGSRPEDSGVYFDGVNIPLLYHFGGLTSVINPEFLEEIEFFPGGFGAEYGRASAGIVDIGPRRLIGEPARGSVKMDMMDTSIFYRQPIGNSLAIGGAFRRSYVDFFLPLFLRLYSGGGAGGVITAAPVYMDYQFKIDWNPNEKHELDLFLFGSSDTLDLVTASAEQAHGLELDVRIAFHRFMLGHSWRITPDLVLRTRPFVGTTLQGGAGAETDGDIDFDASMALLESGIRQDLSYRLTDSLMLRGGIDFYSIWGSGEVDVPIPSELISFPSPMQPTPENQVFDATDVASAFGFWTEAIVSPFSRLQLVPALRFEIYQLPAAIRPLWEPRLSIRYNILDKTTLKAAGGIYHRVPTIIEANPIFGNPEIFPERARHLVLGFEQAITDVIDLDFQIFHNVHTDLVVFSSRTSIEGGSAEGFNFFNSGDGYAYGAETLLRHKITPRAFGWIAYTLMRSERRSRPEADYLPTSTDQTHILTVVGSYRLGGGFEIGSRFRLVTGNPYTPVIGSSHDMDTDSWTPIYGPTRSERLPAFHQLDVRLDYTRVFNTFTLTAFLDLLNSYNRPNVERFSHDYRYRNRVDFTGLPLLPVVGIRGQW